MTQPRRLTAEMREEKLPKTLDPRELASRYLLALSDLDVLEGENEELKIRIQAAPSPQQVKKLHEELAAAQAEVLARTHEREHWHQRALEAEQKLQAMTESRDFWKQMVKDSVPSQDHDITAET